MLKKALIVVGAGVVVSYFGVIGAQADPGDPAIVYVFVFLLATFVVLVAAASLRGGR